jgi:hypothetical protein
MKKLLLITFLACIGPAAKAQMDTISYYKNNLPVTIPCQLWAMVGNNVIFKAEEKFDSVRTKDIIAIIPMADSRFMKQYGVLMKNINEPIVDARAYKETAAYHLKAASNSYSAAMLFGVGGPIISAIGYVTSIKVVDNDIKFKTSPLIYIGSGMGIGSLIFYFIGNYHISQAGEALENNKLGRFQLQATPTSGRLIYRF